MGLGKATREAGKVGTAIQAGLWLWDLGEAIAKRLRRRRSDKNPDEASQTQQNDDDPDQPFEGA